MRLPVAEGPAAIQLSIAKITDALMSGSIDPKRAGRLLYAMQIASRNLESRRPYELYEPVESMTTASNGDELAPDKFVCGDKDDCNECPYTDDCKNWVKDEDDSEEESE